MAQKAKKGAAKKAGGVKAAAKRVIAKAAEKVKGAAKKVTAKKKAAPARGKAAGPAKKVTGPAAKKAARPGKKTVGPAKKAAPAKKLRGYAAGNASTLPGPRNTHAGTEVTGSEGGKPLRRVSARLSGASVDDYIASAPVPHKAVLAEIRQVVMTACPEAEVSIKWGQPVFDCNGPFAWMKAYPRYVSIGFFRGTELPDPDKALKGTGSKMRHVKVTEPQHVPVATLDALVRAAVKLNQQKGDSSKRTGR